MTMLLGGHTGSCDQLPLLDSQALLLHSRGLTPDFRLQTSDFRLQTTDCRHSIWWWGDGRNAFVLITLTGSTLWTTETSGDDIGSSGKANRDQIQTDHCKTRQCWGASHSEWKEWSEECGQGQQVRQDRWCCQATNHLPGRRGGSRRCCSLMTGCDGQTWVTFSCYHLSGSASHYKTVSVPD